MGGVLGNTERKSAVRKRSGVKVKMRVSGENKGLKFSRYKSRGGGGLENSVRSSSPQINSMKNAKKQVLLQEHDGSCYTVTE